MEAYLNMAGPGVSIAIHLKIMNSNIHEGQFLQSMDINQDMELSFHPHTQLPIITHSIGRASGIFYLWVRLYYLLF